MQDTAASCLFTHTLTTEPNSLGRGFATSIQGARHVRDNTVCQDSSIYCLYSDTICFGVADGHGDHKHALSHIGSKLALDVAIPILCSVLDSISGEGLTHLPTQLKHSIEKRIRWEWNLGCKKHLGMSSSDGSWIPELVQFGTTLLMCCQNKTHSLFFQLGDGDIAVMNADDTVSFIFDEDQDVTGTVTHSLCRPFEEDISQICMQPNRASNRMILLSTDGIRDCLQGERDRFATILPWLVKKSNEPIEATQQWLYKISNSGNGDDISLAIHTPYLTQTDGESLNGNA